MKPAFIMTFPTIGQPPEDFSEQEEEDLDEQSPPDIGQSCLAKAGETAKRDRTSTANKRFIVSSLFFDNFSRNPIKNQYNND